MPRKRQTKEAIETIYCQALLAKGDPCPEIVLHSEVLLVRSGFYDDTIPYPLCDLHRALQYSAAIRLRNLETKPSIAWTKASFWRAVAEWREAHYGAIPRSKDFEQDETLPSYKALWSMYGGLAQYLHEGRSMGLWQEADEHNAVVPHGRPRKPQYMDDEILWEKIAAWAKAHCGMVPAYYHWGSAENLPSYVKAARRYNGIQGLLAEGIKRGIWTPAAVAAYKKNSKNRRQNGSKLLRRSMAAAMREVQP